jgi:hypothetical protein
LEDILGYIIVFGLIIVFTLIYFSKKENEKLFSLTKKLYSFGSLDVMIKKKGSDIEFIILKTESFKHQFNKIADILIEFPDTEKNKEPVSIEMPDKLFHSKSFNEYYISYHDFLQFTEQFRKQHEPFRFVIDYKNANKMKSGNLAFNKYRKVYLPDSGRYN